MVRSLLLSSFLLVSLQAARAQTLPAGRGNVTLMNLKLETHMISQRMVNVVVHGDLRNDSSLPIRGVILQANMHGRDGEDLKCMLECSISIAALVQPGETVSLDRGLNQFVWDLTQPLASSEWVVKSIFYSVVYMVDAPVIIDPAYQVSAKFDPLGLVLELKNTSTEFIEIAWDQSVYVDESGNTSRLIRGNVKLLDKDRPQPNTTIPPGAKVQETVFPVSHVEAKSDGAGWTERPIFANEVAFAYGSSAPIVDAPDVRGKEIKLYLRLLVGEQKRNVPITFKVVSMAK